VLEIDNKASSTNDFKSWQKHFQIYSTKMIETIALLFLRLTLLWMPELDITAILTSKTL